MRTRTLLFEVGLILVSIALGKIFDFTLGYVIAGILGIAFIVQWAIQGGEEGEKSATNTVAASDLYTTLTFPKIELIEGKRFGIAKADLTDIRHGKLPFKGIATAFQAAWTTDKSGGNFMEFESKAKISYRSRNNTRFCTEFKMVYAARPEFIEVKEIRHSKT